jgi:hypothetical protein
MKITLIYFFIFNITLATWPFRSCQKNKTGVLEIRTTNISSSATTIRYHAEHTIESNYPEGIEFQISSYGTEFKTAYYWPDETAKKLGYKKLKREFKEYEKFVANKTGDEKNIVEGALPGENGRWKEEIGKIKAAASASSSGANTTGVCATPYVRPSNYDPQLDSFCEAVYAFRCKDGLPLSDPKVQSYCQIYNDTKEPNVPECPYCK